MPRNLDTALAAELAKGSVRPFYLCELTLASGVQHVWSGVGPLVWNGNTYSGLGELAEVGAVHESSGVQADGTTITLNIAPSQLAIIEPTFTLPAGTSLDPPRAPNPGEYMAWSYAASFPLPYLLGPYNAPIWSDGHDIFLSWGPSLNRGFCIGGGLEVTHGGTPGFIPDEADAVLGGYSLPRSVPPGARITQATPMLSIDPTSTGGGANWTGSFAAGDLALSAQLLDTGASFPGVKFGFVAAVAVYYESGSGPLTKSSLLYEAMSDVRVGAPVKLWFGMLSAAGAIVGQPFLTFSGLVDEPTITEDPAGTKIVLALESRLRNHARASGRRYTAADQKLNYPNDSGFNWVEILNEISLKWGS